MKTIKVVLGGGLFALGMVLACEAEGPTEQPSLESAKGKRETVLNRRVHIEPGLAEVPQLPPLCDTLKMKRRRVNVGDCQLYCEIEGSGPALVLINGGPGGTHHGFHPHFARAAAFCEVVYYDQRGCGQSDYQNGKGYTIAQAVDDLDQLRAALKVDRWVVLGWSYGGVVAQCYTVKHPERVAGLVLVGSATDALRLQLQPSRQRQYLSSEERNRIAKLYHNQDLPMDKATYNGHLNGDWKRQSFYKPGTEELARMALYEWKHDPVFRASIGQDLQRIDLRGLFEGCPIPVLLLEGKQDLTWGADKPDKLHACFPGSRLVLFDQSAHGPFSDEPERFFSTLREFIKGLPDSLTGLPKWKERVATRLAEKEKSPE
jgi:proline iminopeptidase